MRGQDTQQAGMVSSLSPEERVPMTHPLRPIRQYVDTALTALSPHLAKLYARTGRPSMAPEKLLRALLLQVLDRLRSERLLMEELPHYLLFRRFVGLDLDAPVCIGAAWRCARRGRASRHRGASYFYGSVRRKAKEGVSARIGGPGTGGHSSVHAGFRMKTSRGRSNCPFLSIP